MQESARHLEMTRARQMRVDTRDLAEADIWDIVPRVELCAKITFGIEQIDEFLLWW